MSLSLSFTEWNKPPHRRPSRSNSFYTRSADDHLSINRCFEAAAKRNGLSLPDLVGQFAAAGHRNDHVRSSDCSLLLFARGGFRTMASAPSGSHANPLSPRSTPGPQHVKHGSDTLELCAHVLGGQGVS